MSDAAPTVPAPILGPEERALRIRLREINQRLDAIPPELEQLRAELSELKGRLEGEAAGSDSGRTRLGRRRQAADGRPQPPSGGPVGQGEL